MLTESTIHRPPCAVPGLLPFRRILSMVGILFLALATVTCGKDAPSSTSVHLTGGALSAEVAQIPEVGAAFRTLEHSSFPRRSLFQERWGGLNFEHVMNGAKADSELNWFTPRTDPHRIDRLSDSSVEVVHEAPDSAWGIESRMKYSFPGGSAVDLEFRVRLTEDRFPLGYVAFMWASYMQGADSPLIHFYGREAGETGWLSMGANWAQGFEAGSISALGAPKLTWEAPRLAMNLATHETRHFVHPFFFGLLDGDGDPATTDDRMAYLMMFDQARSIRIAVWQRMLGPERVDTGRPAWDWQYVIESPRCGRWYGYRARLEYFPFLDRADVLRRYESWREGLPETEYDSK